MRSSDPHQAKTPQPQPLEDILQCLYAEDWTHFTHDWESWRRQPGLTVIFTPNPEQVIQASRSPAFLTVLLRADVLLPDGQGLVWASHRLARTPVQQRFAGRAVVEWWLQEASQRQIATFLLGSAPGVAEALARQVDPHARWCAAAVGYQNVQQPTAEEEAGLRRQIEQHHPEVMFVAFGAPWQEMWVSEHREWLAKLGVKIVMVCGGAFDVLSPRTSLKKPPVFLEKMKLEWFWRLLQEPHRWRRQLAALCFFVMVWRRSRVTADTQP